MQCSINPVTQLVFKGVTTTARILPANTFLLRINHRNTKKIQRRQSGAFTINLELVSYFFSRASIGHFEQLNATWVSYNNEGNIQMNIHNYHKYDHIFKVVYQELLN